MTNSVRALLAEASSLGLHRACELRLPEERFLPVLPALDSLLPAPGLALGTTIRISGVGSTSLALALAARPSQDEWVAVAGMPSLGIAWAAELGVALDRLVVVPDPGAQWTSVLAALVDAFDVVVAEEPRMADRDARKLASRVRETRCVLIAIGDRRTGVDMHLCGVDTRWHGIGRGHGHLAARTLTVSAVGRGAASRPREATLWLPDEDGRVSLATNGARVVRLSSSDRGNAALRAATPPNPL